MQKNDIPPKNDINDSNDSEIYQNYLAEMKKQQMENEYKRKQQMEEEYYRQKQMEEEYYRQQQMEKEYYQQQQMQNMQNNIPQNQIQNNQNNNQNDARAEYIQNKKKYTTSNDNIFSVKAPQQAPPKYTDEPLTEAEKKQIQIQTYLPTKTSKTINAHESNIAFICINNDGNILATASDKGTLIRIFSINSGELITELRRGAKNVKITCLVFDIGNNYIACSSDVGTIHIFNIESVTKYISEEVIDENKESENENKNKKNNKKKLIKNARSFAKFRIQDNSSMVCFGKENFIVIITSEGAYYKATFDPKNGGNCCKVEEQVINV